MELGLKPKGKANRPNAAFTEDLMADAKARVPRLQYMSEVELMQFLTKAEGSIGFVCEKHRQNNGNGWAFPPLAECRAAWVRLYGPVDWPEGSEWGK